MKVKVCVDITFESDSKHQAEREVESVIMKEFGEDFEIVESQEIPESTEINDTLNT